MSPGYQIPWISPGHHIQSYLNFDSINFVFVSLNSYVKRNVQISSVLESAKSRQSSAGGSTLYTETATTTNSSSASSSPYHRTAATEAKAAKMNHWTQQQQQLSKNKPVFVPSFDLGTSMDDDEGGDSPWHRLAIQSIQPEYVTVPPLISGEVLDMVCVFPNLYFPQGFHSYVNMKFFTGGSFKYPALILGITISLYEVR